MPEDQISGKSVDPLLIELERLRESSRAAMTTFKAIELRLAELERQIQHCRHSTAPSGIRRPGPGS